ncbi:MAG: site-specific integrase [Thermoplasmata archaeon]|nr:site-specific integrase [Thermoplasmata archaeon]
MKEKYLNITEIRCLLSEIDDLEDKCLITLGIDSGCRVSEITNISTSNIDYDSQTIKIWDEKKDQWREIVVTKQTLQLIKMYLNNRVKKSPKLFNFSYKTANRRLKKWCKIIGIPDNKAHWHTLRHTYIMQSRLRGRDIKAVQQQTGDSLLTLLRIYSNLSTNDRVRISEDKPIIPEDVI